MKKTLLATSIALSLGAFAPAANAAFTPLAAGDYSMTITGGCFTFGTCSDTGLGGFGDNTAGQATSAVTPGVVTTRANGATIGSGTVGGDNGLVEFSVNATGDMTITSYRQDSYLATAGGTFFVDALGTAGVSLMSGNIDGSGNVTFTPGGREGMAYDFYSTLGVQPWNIIPGSAPEAFDSFSTGTETAVKGKGGVTMTGSALADTGTAGEWTGVLVSAGNVNGAYWAGFDNTLYTEQFNVTITASAVPVPAAAWLFGSGLLGLVGVARRRKSS